MNSKLRLGLFVVCCSLLALPAFAQLDSPALRARFGSPLNRETFHVPSGFDLTVDYGAGNQVCKLEVPALMPTKEDVVSTDGQNRKMYDFLAELVPNSMRGKELRRFNSTAGIVAVLSIEYEHVTLVEVKYPDRPARNETIVLKFKNDDCRGL